MIGVSLLRTALFLGVFVLLAGGYGTLYGIGRLLARRDVLLTGYACYGLQCVLALGIVGLSPLTSGWKFVLAVFTIAFVGIPPITWRFLERTHT